MAINLKPDTDKKEIEQVNPLVGCLSLIVMFFCIPIGALLDAWVMWRIYNWFLVSVPGFPALVMSNFMGVSLIFGMLISGLTINSVKNQQQKEGEPFNFVKALGFVGIKFFGIPLLTFLIADFYHFLFVR